MTNEAYDFLSDFINSSSYVDLAQSAHEAWLVIKTEQGWSYGPKRDTENKRNPLMVPFSELPKEVRGANNLGPYAVANYFRTHYATMTIIELNALFERILDELEDDLLDKLSEYIHSHFIINLLAQGETTKTRGDMVVYQDLDEGTKSWDTHIGLEVLRFLSNEIKRLFDS